MMGGRRILMEQTVILILGGYGGVGRSLSRLVLRETDAEVVVAGRRKEKAQEFAQALRKEFSDSSVSARYADASDPKSLVEAYRGVDMVLVTATTPQYLHQIALTALGAGCDYLDILVQQNTIPQLRALSSEIAKAGRVFITQAGFHPGLPAVFIRYAAQHFDDYRKALIGMAMNARFEKPESSHEIIHEVGESNAEIYQEGRWRKANYKDAIKVDFGSRFGIRTCFPLQMEEIRELPQTLGIGETGVYVAGFNWFVDNIVFPLIIVFQKIKKGMGLNALGTLMYWGVNTFSSPDLGVVFLLDAEGVKGGKNLRVKIIAEHDDTFLFTSAPVVACLRQYLDGSLTKPGLWFMGTMVDDSRLMEDMKQMGIKIKTEITNGNVR
ncbi:MAG: hypothetical protein DRG87_07975 [Deltaproteobacteria bacterium]|nr:MAG: hypothetical protein DRG87_07975 [Deltaproteobacteria bacterium]